MNNTSTLADGRVITLRPATATDLSVLRQLLADLGLPTAGVDECWPHFTVAESAGRIVGLAGLEVYPDGALLRSVAVHPSWGGTGLGRALVESALGAVRGSGLGDVYLLTTTAEHYFPRLGFSVIPRTAVPTTVRESVEFREACAASAVVLHRSLRDRSASVPSTARTVP